MLQQGDVIVYDSAMHSNMRPAEKSLIRQMYERLARAPEVPSAANAPSDWQGGFWNMVGRQGEATVVGSTLAAVNVFAKDGLDCGPLQTPVDLMTGILLGAGSVPKGTKVGKHLADAGAACMTVFSFRKTTEFLVEKRLAAGAGVPKHLSPGGSRVSGDSTAFNDDPVVKAASSLGKS